MSDDRLRAVVCGTRFGRVYLEAFRQPGVPFELAGILARGSERSAACARQHQVPLYTGPDQLPEGIAVACVVVSAGMNGGRGAELAQQLMARSVHVLQEHPLHHDELAECLRTARRHGVVYHLNTLYPHLAPVRRFLAVAAELLSRQRLLFIDAIAALQVGYPLLDVLGRIVGRLRPWELSVPENQQGLPYRSVLGRIGGVPLMLRLQHQLDPADPDNHAHLLHRITLGTPAGQLTLVTTHGPVLWTPRPHLPAAAENAVRLHDIDSQLLDLPSAEVLGPDGAPPYREVLRSVWPVGVARALRKLGTAVTAGEDPLRRGQYYLTLCRLWQELTTKLGPVELIGGDAPASVPVDVLRKAAGAPAEKGDDQVDVHREVVRR